MTKWTKPFNQTAVVTASVLTCLLAGEAHAQTQVKVTGGKMQTRLENGKMVLTGLDGHMAGGRVQLTGNVQPEGNQPKVAHLEFRDVAGEQLQSYLKGSGWGTALQGAKFSGSIKGEWRGQSVREIASSARGTALLVAGPGKITDKKVLTKLADALKVKELNELSYDSLRLKLNANAGHVTLQELDMTGPDFHVKATGKYAPSADEMRLVVNLGVSHEIAQASSYMKLKNVLGFFGRSDNADQGETAEGLVKVPELLVQGKLTDLKVSLAKGGATETASAPAKSADKAVSAAKANTGWKSELTRLAGL